MQNWSIGISIMTKLKTNSSNQIIHPDWCHGSTEGNDSHECFGYSYDCFERDDTVHQHCKSCSIILGYEESELYCIHCEEYINKNYYSHVIAFQDEVLK